MARGRQAEDGKQLCNSMWPYIFRAGDVFRESMAKLDFAESIFAKTAWWGDRWQSTHALVIEHFDIVHHIKTIVPGY